MVDDDPMSAEKLSGALVEVLRPVLGADVGIEHLQVLTGGASRSTWSFDAAVGSDRRALILRIGSSDSPDPAGREHGNSHHASMELEAAAQLRAAAAGAPVSEVLTADDSPAALGDPYLICTAIPGETLVKRIHRSLSGDGERSRREELLRQCADALAAVHRADPAGIGLPHDDQLAQWRARLDEIGDTTATLEWGFRWLAANRPPPSSPVLVHGDYRMGNVIVDDGELAAVLDWELVHIGEVYEDLAWFCIRAWRFGAPEELGAGGLGAVETFLQAYEAASGTPVDRTVFRWWLAQATLRWGILCRYQADRHLRGQTRSVELAAIGRRVCETEWDLLDVLDGGGPR